MRGNRRSGIEANGSAGKQVEASYERLMAKFVDWARDRPDIRGAIVVGSRARKKYPADEWADLDIIVITTEPEQYIADSHWVEDVGKSILTFVEPTSDGEEKERRVLFEGMLDVDFAIFPLEKVQALMQNAKDPKVAATLADSLGRGVRVLLDKDGLYGELDAIVASVKTPQPRPPTEGEFLEVVNDFLYHAVFTAKHLRRGELWWAKGCSDCYMQRLMLRMAEWHAHALQGWEYDTWFRGRFLERWASREVLNGLRTSFSHYDEKDIGRALLASLDLFSKIAAETAEKLGYQYPASASKSVIVWTKDCL